MTDNKALALDLARIGWFIFPCDINKRPLCKWKETATNDPDAIEVMDWPGLVGIYCQKSGFFAIDLDRKNGVDGLATWERWQESYGKVTPGPVQKTPNNGQHYLFNLPKNLPVPNKAGLFPGIDLRSEGYICTGPGYEWIKPPETTIPEAPDWFINFIDPELEKDHFVENTQPSESSIKSMKEIAGKIGGVVKELPQADYWLNKYIPQATIGRRNETGFNLACQCRDSGITQTETEALPYPEKCPQGKDIYNRAEWLLTVKSAYDRTPREAANIGVSLQHKNQPTEPEAPPDFDVWPDSETQEEPQPIERPRFILRNAAYALQPQPPIDYIVDDLLTNSSVNVIYGEPGSKKTYIALSLAACVSNGKNWLDFKTKKNPVLIIDEESGEKRLSRRLGEAIRGELCDTSSPVFYVSLAGFKLDDLNDPIVIHALIEQTAARLVIFDALADIMDGDENDKKDVQPVFNALRKIAENTDSAILIIHHSNKAGGYRGSSAIKGSIDLMIQVTSENGSNLINFNTEKNRDGDKTHWAAEAIWTESEFYLKASDYRPAESRERELYVIKYLTDNGPSYLADLMAAATTCTPGGAKQGVYALAKQDKVRRTNPGNRKAMYELTSVTRDASVTLPLL